MRPMAGDQQVADQSRSGTERSGAWLRATGPAPPDGNHRARVTGVFVALAERERVEPSAEPAAR